MIRVAREDDLEVLQDIERSAGQPFADLGMPEIAGDEPPSLADLRAYADAGRAWVFEEDGQPVAYVIVDLVDGNAHIEQVSVRAESARRGIGRALIEQVAGWARARGCPALTLTSFVDVPWNVPYYQRLGFVRMTDIGPELRAIRAREAAHGLDRWPRACLRLAL
ncbi:GNAT family N-acetyltransferase [Fodinicola acaciae]|uniref:GNAT family N-acetyltransferase n=1 Tax=Fodinicola acaciae TaxID=2681555 RepID=UPI0013D29D4E|nr:GNAT family N-acetyltransferase [Fodinicola acaciae]